MGVRLQSVDEVVEQYSVASSPLKSKIYVGFGCLFVVFAIIGIWVPGWPTVSWAVPAAFLFSMSNERLFRWTLTNRYFGDTLFDYYATGKSLPKHVKVIIMIMISFMTSISTYFVWAVSTKGDGVLMDPSSWNGADPGYGSATILVVGIIGIWYVASKVRTRVS
ncbi:MAG: YbaN family protein [Candidatus Thalassarchaeaceae archaeon]|nr:YbaN family protein [Candidatus Thalassarchaeaceae archaeon]